MASDKPESVNPFGDGPKLTGADMDRMVAARKAQGATAGKDMGPPLPKVLSDHNRKKTLDDMANMEKIIQMAKAEKLAQANQAPEFARQGSHKRSPEEMEALERTLHKETHQRAEAAAQASTPSYVSDSKESNRGTVDQIDARREKARRTRLLMKTLEMRDWIYGLLKKDVSAEQKAKGPAGQAADFITSLEDGIMLCKLIKVVAPNETIHVEEGPKANPFYKRDNVSNFLKAAAKIGVPVQSMFMTDDLVSRKNDDMVVSALMSFAREAMKHGVAPPLIIQYEMDIDEENHEDDNNGAPIIMVEEAQPDETEDEKSKREEIEKLTIQIKELESDIKAEVGEDEGDDEDMASASGSPTVTAAEQQQRAKKQDKKAASRARREKAKAKYQQLKDAQLLEGQLAQKSGEKYKAIKGDAIDEAVQKAVNDPDNKFYQSIRIRRAKKLGKAASAKRSKREKEGGGIYRVGSAHKVHVRLMQEMLFVRQGNQWVDFNLFVHDQIEADNRAHARVHGESEAKQVWVPKGSASPPPAGSSS